MDLRPILHQQQPPRYVPFPPSQPPFPDNPNFYRPHHPHHHLPPPPGVPPPPLPPGVSYHPVTVLPPPPPPSYNPHHSQFTFGNPNNRPIEDNSRSHHADFSVPPRSFDEDRSGHRAPEFNGSYVDSRTVPWEPHRVPPENWAVRPQQPVRDLDHRSFDHNPVSQYRTIDNFRHDSETSSRFRDEFNDKFSQNQKEDFPRGRSNGRDDNHRDNYRRGHFELNSNKPRRNSPFGNSHASNSNQSRDFAKQSGNYESLYDYDGESRNGSRYGGESRIVSRYRSDYDGESRNGYRYDSDYDGDSRNGSRYGSEYDGESWNRRGDGFRENRRRGQFFREEPKSSGRMGSDEFSDGDDMRVALRKVGRYNDRDSRESTQELDRTTTKQVQKKSAFLRIQRGKPNYGNQNDELLESSFSDRRREGEQIERQGSPVDLDVSFKSNSLVAKAIVPASSSAVDSDRDLTPRNRKIKKRTLVKPVNSSTQPTKCSEDLEKLDNSKHVANNTSSSGKKRKQSGEKVTKRAGERSPKGTVSDKDDTRAELKRKPVVMVLKKKKVVKKSIVKPALFSSPQPKEKVNGSVKTEGSIPKSDKGLMDSKERTTLAGIVSGKDDVMQPCPNEVAMLPESNKLDRNPQTTVIETGVSDIDRMKNRLTLPLGLQTPEETKNDDDPVAADRSVHHGLRTISNSDNSLNNLQHNTTFRDSDCVDDQKKAIFKGGSELRVSVIKDCSPKIRRKRKVWTPDLNSLNSGITNIHAGPVNVAGSTNGMDTNISCSVKEPSPVNKGVSVSGVENLAVSQLGIDEGIQRNTSKEEFSEEVSVGDGANFRPNQTSYVYNKKKKVIATHLGLSEDTSVLCDSGSLVKSTNQNDNMDIDNSIGEKFTAYSGKEKIDHLSKPSEIQNSNSDQRSQDTDMECTGNLLVNDVLPSVRSHPPLSTCGDGVSTIKSSGKLMGSVSDTLFNMVSPETLSIVPEVDVCCEQPLGQTSNKMVSGDYKGVEGKAVVEVGSDVFSHNSFSQNTKINLNKLNSECATENEFSLTGKAVPSQSQEGKVTSYSLNPMGGESNAKKSQPRFAVPRMFPARSSFVLTNSKKIASSTHIANPRTWHRTDNPSAAPLPEKKTFSGAIPSQGQLPGKVAKVQTTSYVRKGNTLVRKPTPLAALSQGSHSLNTSVYRLNSSGIDEMRKSTGPNNRVDVTDPPSVLRTGGMNAAIERPQTPPLPLSTILSNSTGDCKSSSLAEPLLSGCSETLSDSTRLIEDKDVPKSSDDTLKIVSGIPDNQTGPIKSLESKSVQSDGNMMSSKMNIITYVKRKSNQLVSNQLVTASNPCNMSVQDADKAQALPADGYYKKRKNQLVRTSLEDHIKQQVSTPDDSSNSERQRAPKAISSRSASKRRADKGIGTACKRSKFSLVWTLCDKTSSTKVGNSLQRQEVLPHLFPWKRATYRRSFMQNSATTPNSLSPFSRKLLTLRKRDAVYTRSAHGFSLRKSKVLSVGGSSLTWSKSIDSHSKKANEEATLAVAAAEKRRREHNGVGCVNSGAKTRSYSFRERIFRVGAVRYRMDSSKRTLQRISDDESSCPAALEKKDSKKSYVPRRLVIGNEEYVRIGNGNQLVRDPKKRVRILASEKVRWSLHTARLRLAKKRKYCQFFTRFGQCNKDDGKCPYIHDPSKIAVCTKFLSGLCSSPNCKLTHKVIPERMQDCSYFLQGLCSHKDCPYRHVNVNPNASTCEAFLRGYCADGNECRKKHSYVCPDFEATGNCPQGSKCKLHHPKNRSRGKRKTQSKEQNNARGRYFGSTHMVESGGALVLEKHFEQGDLTDYISLGFSDEEAGEEAAIDSTTKETAFLEEDSFEMDLDDLDRVIKPMRIMYDNLKT